MIEYKILDSSDIEDITNLDQIRLASFSIKEGNNFFIDNIKSGNMQAIEMIVNNNVVGGAYLFISPNTHSITIERIFILDKYQHNGFASLLLEHILSLKELFEDKYNMIINCSIAEPSNDELIKFYKQNGYKGPNAIGTMKRYLDYEITNIIKK